MLARRVRSPPIRKLLDDRVVVFVRQNTFASRLSNRSAGGRLMLERFPLAIAVKDTTHGSNIPWIGPTR